MRNCTYLFALLNLLVSVSLASPNTFTYQGRIVRDDSTALEYSNVSFAFTIMNASGNCVIYREQRDHVNMQGSKGVFDVPIGSGTKMFPASPTFKLSDAFNNAVIQNCEGGSTYTPAANDIRILAVQFHDGTGWKDITPNAEIRSVPFSSYADSAGKLGDRIASDFVLKNSVSTCAAGQYLTFDGTNFTCQNDAGGAGMVSDVNVTAPLTKGGTTSIPVIGVNVGTAAGTVAAGNDSRFTDARTPTGAASGDLSGSYPSPTVAKIQGVDVSNTAPTAGQFFKFTAGKWAAAVVDVSDVNNLASTLSGYHTTAAFNTAVGSANCAAYETPYWSSVAGKFLCQSINVSLTGDVSGTIGATSVDKIKGVNVSATAPTTGEVLKYDGTKWAPAADNNAGGTVTNVTASAPLTVTNGSTTPALSISQANGTTNGYLSSADWTAFNGKQSAGNYVTALTGDVTAAGPGSAAATVAKLQGSTLTLTAPANKDYLKFNGTAFVNSPLAASDLIGAISAANMPAFSGDVTSSAGSTTLTLANAGTAGTYYKVTTDAKGRVTSGASSLIAADIPNLDWSKITSGKPTTLAGYGIGDALVSNAGGSPSIQTGLDASKPASPSAGALYFATDSKVIYQYNSGAWISMASAAGSGGTITGITAGTGLSGGGTTGPVTVNLANTAVTAGSYTRANITVDAQGRITTAANGSNINLASEVTGILPIANGGTGASTALAAFNALSPLNTKGDILARDGSNNIRLAVGGDGQVLSADSTQTSGLKWITPANGTVTNVTGTAPIVVTNNTTTPAISVNAATTSTQGVVQVGAGIAVSSGTITADPANFPSAVPVSKGGTGATSMTANRLIASNGTGSAYVPFNCTLGQLLTFDASGVMGCTSYASAGFFANGGNTFGAAATLGTNDNYTLGFKTNNAVAMTIDTSGKVGIGTTSPSDLLTISQVDGGGGLTVLNTSSTASRSPQVKIKNFNGSFSGGGSLIFENARGTSAAATAISSGDNLGQVLFQGLSNGSNYAAGAQIYAQASESWTPSTAGTNLIFNTISSGSTSNSERMRIDGATGRIGIGTSSPNNLLQVGPNGANANPYGVYVGSYLNTNGQAQYVGNWKSSNYWGIGPANYANDSIVRIGTTDQLGNWTASQNLNLAVTGSISNVMESADSTIWAKAVTSTAVNSGGSFVGTRARGTLAAPTYPLSGDLMAQFLGKNGITGLTNPGMVIWASENQTASAQGDYITFYTTPNGSTTSAQRMRIANDGKVGIGTSSPTNLLDLKGATSGARLLYLESTGTGSDQRASMQVGGWEVGQDSIINGTKDFFIWDGASSSLRFDIDANGWATFNKGGVSPAIAPLTLYNPSAPYMGFEEGDTGQKFYVGVDGTNYWIRPGPTTASANALTINPGGLVAINGMPNTSYNFTVNGSAVGNTAWTSVSDMRLKTNIHKVPDALAKIEQLRGVTFDWRHDVRPGQNFPYKRDMGVIAQEVEKVFPEAVDTDSEGFKAVGYTKLIGPLIESTKELAGLCKMNESQLTKLQQTIDRQSREIASLQHENAELREAICEINPKSKICKKK